MCVVKEALITCRLAAMVCCALHPLLVLSYAQRAFIFLLDAVVLVILVLRVKSGVTSFGTLLSQSFFTSLRMQWIELHGAQRCVTSRMCAALKAIGGKWQEFL